MYTSEYHLVIACIIRHTPTGDVLQKRCTHFKVWNLQALVVVSHTEEKCLISYGLPRNSFRAVGNTILDICTHTET